jgi:hypothetical protein
MSLETNLNSSPYWDDYNEDKDYYKILFKPGYGVQTRELNQLQTLLQKQVERFGDNIFKTGTIVEGCHITFHKEFPYVKIKDLETNGQGVNVDKYNNLYIKNSANVQAFIMTSFAGFESQAPDLNTLYLKYVNAGNDANTFTFSANQTLTIYDPAYPLTRVDVANGAAKFSNSDVVVFTNAIEVQNSVGGGQFASGFYPGDFITNGLGANVQITTVKQKDNSVVLRYKPKVSSLSAASAAEWNLNLGDSILNANTGQTATISEVVGSGARAKVKTSSVGTVVSIEVVSRGSGYIELPEVTIQSQVANTTNLSNLSLLPDTYEAKVTSANTLNNSIGTGYGLSINKGTIYQKGYFQKVKPQILVVEKYNTLPDSKVVGFQTEEEIIDSNLDSSLKDLAQGTPNYAAPGADRLKLTPQLTVLGQSEAETRNDFLSIVEFAKGNAYQQLVQTQYNTLEREIAKRTFEENGNFVVDPFLVATSSTDFAQEQNFFALNVDPGIAYINGFRVATQENYSKDIEKGKKTRVVTSQKKLNYGNYVRIQKLGGRLNSSDASLIELHGTPKNYGLVIAADITTPGNLIGYARIRSLVAQDQSAGLYRAYLYDIRMNSGKSFQSVRSLFYDGTIKGVADIVTDSSGNAIIYDTNNSGIVYDLGIKALKTASNVSYTYRVDDTTKAVNTSGRISKSLSSGEVFPYVGSLNSAELEEIIVIPQANAQAQANITGSVSVNTSSNILVGTSTSFVTQVEPGDYLKIANTTANVIVRVSASSNNTTLIIDGNGPATMTGNAVLFFPKNTPIDLTRPGRTATVSGGGTQLEVNLGTNLDANRNIVLVHNIKTENSLGVSKSVLRDQVVRIDTASNAAGAVGPWLLGVTDIFRLKKVYVGSNNTFTTAQGTDITNEFYIDHNQSEDFYGLGYLYKKPKSTYAMANKNLIVVFDSFSSTEGLSFVDSYPINDTIPLANSSSTINTVEIPELYSVNDRYYDLRDCIDFRIRETNTANVTANVASATLNPIPPTNSARFNISDKKFPAPDTDFFATFEYYEGRKDIVILDETGDIRTIKGNNSEEYPLAPENAITLEKLNVPAYPSLPFVLSKEMVDFCDTRIANEKYTQRRKKLYTISNNIPTKERKYYQPRVYTMEDIGSLARRIDTLEYYTALTFEELAAQNRNLPSQVDPTLQRFKFGFFVDSFDNDRYSDSLNPEFSCEFRNGRLTPKYTRLNVELQAHDTDNLTGNSVVFPFNEITISSQNQATISSDVVSTPQPNTGIDLPADPTPVEPITTGVLTTYQKITNVFVQNKHRLVNKNGSVFETQEFFMSQEPGPIEMYFNFRDNDNAIEIFQGTTPNFSTVGLTPIRTGLNAVALSVGDKINKAYGMGKLETLDSTPQYLGSPAKPAREDSGKIIFNHDPAGGQYYKIVIYKYRKSGSADDWKGVFYYRLFYPIDATEIRYVTVLPATVEYQGNLNVDPGNFVVQSILSGSSQSLSQAFRVSVTALKPNTEHQFFVNGRTEASFRPVGKSVGDKLVTDASGKVEFDYYYNSGSETVSDFTAENTNNSYIFGTKALVVKTLDGYSLAQGNIYFVPPAAAIEYSPIGNGINTTSEFREFRKQIENEQR